MRKRSTDNIFTFVTTDFMFNTYNEKYSSIIMGIGTLVKTITRIFRETNPYS